MSFYDNLFLETFRSIDRTLKRIAQVLEDEHNDDVMLWHDGFNLIPLPVRATSEDDENGPH